ncbi:MAG: hypothetical protein IV100_20385 [Myxococcales bacterium]|nr:hypothetical protein [Myxococcales bacterium]
MEGAALVGAVLAGVLVGVLIPLLLEARALLRATRRQVEELGPKLADVLVQARAATATLNKLSADVAPIGPQVAELADALASAAMAVQKVRTGINMAAAVGPAVMAAIHAFRTVSEERRRDDEDESDSGDDDVSGPAERSGV